MTKMKPTIKKKAALFVDGESEKWYFLTMKRVESIKNIDLQPKLPRKKKIKEQFEEVKSACNDYDLVFWIIDLDKIIESEKDKAKGNSSPKTEFLKYYNDSEKIKNLEIIIVNPCLEYWFALHFEYTSRYFSGCSQANTALKKHLSSYEKTEKYILNGNLYKKLKSHQPNAITNSKKVGDFDPNNFNKSVCEIYKLFNNEFFNIIDNKNPC